MPIAKIDEFEIIVTYKLRIWKKNSYTWIGQVFLKEKVLEICANSKKKVLEKIHDEFIGICKMEII